MAIILCIESSARNCSVAIADGETVLAYQETLEPMGHSKEITLLIKACLDSVKYNFEDLDAVAISKGPGSYTGLRVGTSSAKGISYALNIPLIAIETTEIIAAPFVAESSKHEVYIPLIDARRSEVYYCVFDKNLNKLEQTQNKILRESSFQNYENVLFCGDGAQKAKEILKHRSAQYIEAYPKAGDMALRSAQQFAGGMTEDTAYFSPFYLKPPNITKSEKPLF